MANLNGLINNINDIQNSLNQNSGNLSTENRNSFNSDGFSLPASYQADGNGLPSQKVKSNNDGRIKRNIITWFVPEFGAIKMFINPQRIIYTNNKLINKSRTKGGYAIQYWGEELTTLNISGTTGSSGIEGINVLEEIYRAEQLAFDGFGLSMAATNAQGTSGAANIVNEIGGALGSGVSSLFGGSGGSTASAGGAGLLSGILGMDSTNANLATRNIPSLAQLAFTVEMYYDNVVYRGFFENMTVTESAQNFCFDYDIRFTVTQKRGYRTNYFPFHRSANNGPSQYTTPNSFSGNVR